MGLRAGRGFWVRPAGEIRLQLTTHHWRICLMTTNNTDVHNENSNTILLKNKAMTVKLFRKKINRNTMDKELSDLLIEQKNVAEKGSVRVNKSIFPKSLTDPYQKIISETAKFFYRTTSPWDDKGYRLLSVKMYKEFTKQIKKYTREFREAVNYFIDHLEGAIEEQKAALGDAFNRNDYQHLFHSNGQINREYLEDCFNLEIEFGTVSDADDLRASLTEEDREILKQHITEKNNEKFAKSQRHIIDELRDAILSVHERLCKEENIFRDTLIGNLEELCDLIPKMNVAGDPAIDQLAADAKAKLCKLKSGSKWPTRLTRSLVT
jgi:hypothetical protein